MNFYDVYWEQAQKIKSKPARCEFLSSIIEYYYTESEPTFKHDIADVGFTGIKKSLDNQIAKKNAGREGGTKKAENVKQTSSKTPSKEGSKALANGVANEEQTAKQNETSINKGKDKGISKEELTIVSSKKVRFAPPTLEDVSAYIAEKGYTVNPERFHAHYESVGWKVGKNQMKDWRAAIRSWQSREPSQSGVSVDERFAKYR